MEQLTQEKLIEINKEIQEVLSKHGVTIQPTMGISFVPLPPTAEIVKEAEIISPIQNEDLEKN